MQKFNDFREFLKSGDWDAWENIETDQRKKIARPESQKGYSKDAIKYDLVKPEEFTLGGLSVLETISKRRSRRQFTDEHLTLEELSYMLWATQGVSGEKVFFRTVPSGGARHPFETYLFIKRVEGLDEGMYRYLPLEHKIVLLYSENNLSEKVTKACRNQEFVDAAAVTFIWTVIPYRGEWRYDTLAHKVMALDAGHLCQNLYLAAESIDCGTCAIGAYDQETIDRVIGVDGQDEFTIYISPVGKTNHI